MSDMLVDVGGVGKSVTSSSQTIEILKAVDLTLRPGKRLCIIGASGSGKSSLLEILGTLSTPKQGTGADIGSGGGRHWRCGANAAPARGDRLRVPGLQPDRSCECGGQCGLAPEIPGGWPQGSAEAREGGARQVRAFRARRPALQPAFGRRETARRLSRALVTKPKLILSDEPTGNLDEETGRHILKLLMDSVDADCGLIMSPTISTMRAGLTAS
nr:ATP-binding cassette domain-containing protein [Martelella lutilitoris]